MGPSDGTPDTRGIRRLSGSLVMLSMRSDLPRQQCMDYWQGPHSQLVARTPGFREYRQHHFSPDAVGLWPDVDNIDTTISDDRRLDGTPEVWFQSLLSPLKSLSHNKIVSADEHNVFGRTVLDISVPWGGRWFDTTDTAPTSFRSVVLLRQRPGATRRSLASLLGSELGPVLASIPGVTEVRTLAFAPHLSWLWNTPGVAHDYPEDRRFHGCVIVGARDESALRAALITASVRVPPLQSVVDTIHAYPVEATYVYRRDGRPTLPQNKPAPKPRLNPVRRTVPQAPTTTTLPGLPPTSEITLPGTGPEDVIVDNSGRVLCGLEGGAIVRLDPVALTTEVVADTGGRPLGLEVMPDGRVLVCDAHKGLLLVDPESGHVDTLVRYIDGVPLRFCSNAATGTDGTIWFTESTSRYDFEHFLGALLEHRPSGRLFRRDPDGTVEVVLDGLHFANGLALSPDRQSLLFAETGNYSVSRLHLSGPDAGAVEPVLENLGGFPDNMSPFVDGKSWIALANPRASVLDSLANRPGFIRKLIWKLPDRLQPEAEKTVWAIAIDPDGRVVQEVHGNHPTFFGATGAAELRGMLYIASPDRPTLLAVSLDASTVRGQHV